MAGKKGIWNLKKYLHVKVKLYMHNPVGGIRLTNITRETNYFLDFVQYPK